MNRRRPHDPVALSVDPGRDPAGWSEAPNHPLDVVILGDFSAREHGGGAGGRPVAERRPQRVESVDQALFTVRPSVTLRLVDGHELTLYFEELEDFHPDRLLDRAPELTRAVRAVRGPEPATSPPDAAAGEGAGAPPGANERPSAGLLDDLVAAAETPERGAAPLGDLRAWVREVVGPHLHGAEGSQEDARSAAEEEALATVLRGVLHHPALRALERIWRSLLVLARAASASDDVRLYILDLSRAELREMLDAPSPAEMPLFRVLESPLPGRGAETPVALLVGCHELGAGAEAVVTLNRLAMVASALGAPWLGGAEPSLLGLRSFGEVGEHGVDDGSAAWSAFRATPAAASVAVFGPRFLLREPYGRDGERCEALELEELAGPGAGHLWGSAAVLAAAAAVEQFARHAWAFELEAPHVFDGMPIDVRADGAIRAHPLEELLSLDASNALREAGMNPLLGFREEARVRLAGTMSAAAPPDRLRSWWRA